MAAEVASLLSEREVSVPWQYGARTGRGLFDRRGSMQQLSHGAAIVQQDTLYVARGSIPDLAEESELLVGEVGQDLADGVTAFNVGFFGPIEDGLIISIALTGGPAGVGA